MHLAATLYVELFIPIVAITFLAALRWGGLTEILGATAFLLATDLQKILEGVLAPMFVDFEPFVATIDIALLVILLMLALREPRVWILCATAIQLIVCLAHVGKLFRPDISPLAYAILMGSGGYPSQVLLIIGIYQRTRRSSPIGFS